MLEMLVLRMVDGPSSGMSETTRDEVDARELRVGTDDLRETREVADVRAATRPGIFKLFAMSMHTASSDSQAGSVENACRKCSARDAKAESKHCRDRAEPR